MTKKPVRKLNANVLAIAGVVLMILLAVLAVKLFPRQEEPEAGLPEGFEVIEDGVPTAEPTGAPAADPTDVPAGEPTEVPAGEPTAVPDAEPTAVPANLTDPDQAYLVVTAGGVVYEPIPLTGHQVFGLRRGDYINVIEVTEDSICMAESTCDNQDCVQQGVVTMENRKTRVLQNMILCLPNDVGLELCTFAELQERMPEWAEELLQ